MSDFTSPEIQQYLQAAYEKDSSLLLATASFIQRTHFQPKQRTDVFEFFNDDWVIYGHDGYIEDIEERCQIFEQVRQLAAKHGCLGCINNAALAVILILPLPVLRRYLEVVHGASTGPLPGVAASNLRLLYETSIMAMKLCMLSPLPLIIFGY